MIRFSGFVAVVAVVLVANVVAADDAAPLNLDHFFTPPAEFVGQFGDYRSPLEFDDGRPVTNAFEWSVRRREIRAYWDATLGAWPPLVERPKVEIVDTSRRDNFTQHKVMVQVAPKQMLAGYLLVPDGDGPFPAVVVPYYDPETGVGLGNELRDFGLQLARRGFVTLSIGSPGGSATKPDLAGATCQPLSYHGYVAANCYNALAARPDVDPKRIGVVGHSYGGKWSMFASCLYDKFACAVWSDGGVVFDESRGSVNYWEPWYLGFDPSTPRPVRGLVTPENPRTGPYIKLIADGRDLHELHALMTPRPFLVSGGAEDRATRWIPLNHAVAVNGLLGVTKRVGMTNRPSHAPTEESNAQIYAFFEQFLKSPPRELAVVAHRGLLLDSPENTLPNFQACVDAQLGFEFDVRRTRDGVLVCLHDETLDRTTDGTGPIVEAAWSDVQKLDAGGWFAPSFAGLKVPTIDEVLTLIAAHPASRGVYAVDMKADDDAVEADVVRLAKKHGVLDRLLFIGRTIDHADVRKRLRAADKTCRVAVLAQTREDLSAVIAAADADWVYLRFVPTADDIAAIRAASKQAIIAGPTVAAREVDNWKNATAAGIDAVLTDYPVELRRQVNGLK